MADWVTISSLATAGGTLVLAMATFASVRSANQSARVAERSLLVGGTLEIDSRPGKGTIVKLEVPIREPGRGSGEPSLQGAGAR